MLDKYCNQKAVLEVRSKDRNVYGEYDYGVGQTIYVRKQDVIKEIKTDYDTKEISTATYYTTFNKPEVGDKIDSNEILFVAEWVDFGGKIVGYKVMV